MSFESILQSSFSVLLKALLSKPGKQVARTRLWPDDPPMNSDFLLTSDDSISFLTDALEHHEKIIVWKEEFEENDNYSQLGTDRDLWEAGIPCEMEKRIRGFQGILSPYVFKPDDRDEIWAMFSEIVDAARALKVLVPESHDFYWTVISLLNRDVHSDRRKGENLGVIITWLNANRPSGVVCKILTEIARKKVLDEIHH